MISDPLSAIAVIAMAAALCQWIGAHLRIPSVLVLLIAGVALNPVLDPDEIFGELLFTTIGIGVAVLLFEGATSLRWDQLTVGRGAVIRLVTIGAAVAWIVGSIAAKIAINIQANIAVLIGAVLIVSGPTVVLPLLRVVRPREPADSILRWEGIVIDPIGAAIAIVVLDAIVEERSPPRVLIRVATTFGAGIAIGTVVAAFIIEVLRRRMVADHLHVSLTLAALIGAYALANLIRPEAGLIAATILGLGFANQRRTPANHITEFNEHLGTSILGVLFITLGARVDLVDIVENLLASVTIAAALIIIGRPLAVIASTVGTGTDWRTRAFLMTLAPRGVVAAAVASLFALELEHGDIDPGPLGPVVFTVVVITVTIASASAAIAARRLRIAHPEPTGVAIIGGGRLAVALAETFNKLDIGTLHIGLDDAHHDDAAARGQLVYSDRLDTQQFHDTVSSLGISTAIALSDTDHLNGFAVDRLAAVIDTANIYGLYDPESDNEPGTAQRTTRQPILPDHITAERLQNLIEAGIQLRVTNGSHYHPQSGWLTICRVDVRGNLDFDPDPTKSSDGDRLIQVGPGLTPTEQT